MFKRKSKSRTPRAFPFLEKHLLSLNQKLLAYNKVLQEATANWTPRQLRLGVLLVCLPLALGSAWVLVKAVRKDTAGVRIQSIQQPAVEQPSRLRVLPAPNAAVRWRELRLQLETLRSDPQDTTTREKLQQRPGLLDSLRWLETFFSDTHQLH